MECAVADGQFAVQGKAIHSHRTVGKLDGTAVHFGGIADKCAVFHRQFAARKIDGSAIAGNRFIGCKFAVGNGQNGFGFRILEIDRAAVTAGCVGVSDKGAARNGHAAAGITDRAGGNETGNIHIIQHHNTVRDINGTQIVTGSVHIQIGKCQIQRVIGRCMDTAVQIDPADAQCRVRSHRKDVAADVADSDGGIIARTREGEASVKLNRRIDSNSIVHQIDDGIFRCAVHCIGNAAVEGLCAAFAIQRPGDIRAVLIGSGSIYPVGTIHFSAASAYIGGEFRHILFHIGCGSQLHIGIICIIVNIPVFTQLECLIHRHIVRLIDTGPEIGDLRNSIGDTVSGTGSVVSIITAEDICFGKTVFIGIRSAHFKGKQIRADGIIAEEGVRRQPQCPVGRGKCRSVVAHNDAGKHGNISAAGQMHRTDRLIRTRGCIARNGGIGKIRRAAVNVNGTAVLCGIAGNGHIVQTDHTVVCHIDGSAAARGDCTVNGTVFHIQCGETAHIHRTACLTGPAVEGDTGNFHGVGIILCGILQIEQPGIGSGERCSAGTDQLKCIRHSDGIAQLVVAAFKDLVARSAQIQFVVFGKVNILFRVAAVFHSGAFRVDKIQVFPDVHIHAEFQSTGVADPVFTVQRHRLVDRQGRSGFNGQIVQHIDRIVFADGDIAAGGNHDLAVFIGGPHIICTPAGQLQPAVAVSIQCHTGSHIDLEIRIIPACDFIRCHTLELRTCGDGHQSIVHIHIPQRVIFAAGITQTVEAVEEFVPVVSLVCTEGVFKCQDSGPFIRFRIQDLKISLASAAGFHTRLHAVEQHRRICRDLKCTVTGHIALCIGGQHRICRTVQHFRGEIFSGITGEPVFAHIVCAVGIVGSCAVISHRHIVLAADTADDVVSKYEFIACHRVCAPGNILFLPHAASANLEIVVGDHVVDQQSAEIVVHIGKTQSHSIGTLLGGIPGDGFVVDDHVVQQDPGFGGTPSAVTDQHVLIIVGVGNDVVHDQRIRNDIPLTAGIIGTSTDHGPGINFVVHKNTLVDGHTTAAVVLVDQTAVEVVAVENASFKGEARHVVGTGDHHTLVINIGVDVESSGFVVAEYGIDIFDIAAVTHFIPLHQVGNRRIVFKQHIVKEECAAGPAGTGENTESLVFAEYGVVNLYRADFTVDHTAAETTAAAVVAGGCETFGEQDIVRDKCTARDLHELGGISCQPHTGGAGSFQNHVLKFQSTAGDLECGEIVICFRRSAGKVMTGQRHAFGFDFTGFLVLHGQKTVDGVVSLVLRLCIRAGESDHAGMLVQVRIFPEHLAVKGNDIFRTIVRIGKFLRVRDRFINTGVFVVIINDIFVGIHHQRKSAENGGICTGTHLIINGFAVRIRNDLGQTHVSGTVIIENDQIIMPVPAIRRHIPYIECTIIFISIGHPLNDCFIGICSVTFPDQTFRSHMITLYRQIVVISVTRIAHSITEHTDELIPVGIFTVPFALIHIIAGEEEIVGPVAVTVIVCRFLIGNIHTVGGRGSLNRIVNDIVVRIQQEDQISIIIFSRACHLDIHQFGAVNDQLTGIGKEVIRFFIAGIEDGISHTVGDLIRIICQIQFDLIVHRTDFRRNIVVIVCQIGEVRNELAAESVSVIDIRHDHTVEEHHGGSSSFGKSAIVKIDPAAVHHRGIHQCNRRTVQHFQHITFRGFRTEFLRFRYRILHFVVVEQCIERKQLRILPAYRDPCSIQPRDQYAFQQHGPVDNIHTAGKCQILKQQFVSITIIFIEVHRKDFFQTIP